MKHLVFIIAFLAMCGSSVQALTFRNDTNRGASVGVAMIKNYSQVVHKIQPWEYTDTDFNRYPEHLQYFWDVEVWPTGTKGRPLIRCPIGIAPTDNVTLVLTEEMTCIKE